MGGLAHLPQRLRDFLVGDNIQERGFLEYRGEALAERAVEDCVAGRVRKIGEEDKILFSELRRTMEIEISTDGGSQDRNCRDCSFPLSTHSDTLVSPKVALTMTSLFLVPPSACSRRILLQNVDSHRCKPGGPARTLETKRRDSSIV